MINSLFWFCFVGRNRNLILLDQNPAGRGVAQLPRAGRPTSRW